MTLHIVYNHQCPKCETYYIPYDEDVPCPNCGLVEPERYDFVSEAVRSAQYNLRCNGSYMPSAWWVGTLGDHVLHTIFRLLEEYRVSGEGEIFMECAAREIDEALPATSPHMRNHILNIAIRVYEEMTKEGDLQAEEG